MPGRPYWAHTRLDKQGLNGRPQPAERRRSHQCIEPFFSLGVCDDDEQVRALEAAQLDDRARERHARPRNPPVSKAQVQLAFRRLPAPEVTSSWPSFGQPRPISRSGRTNAGRPWVQGYRPCSRHSASLQQETEGADAVAEVEGTGRAHLWWSDPCEVPKRPASAFDGVVQLLDSADVLRVTFAQPEA